jgi:glycosyltransferase involved in cell wall biosynthesis
LEKKDFIDSILPVETNIVIATITGKYTASSLAAALKEKGILEFIEAAETVKKLGYIANFNILGPFYKSGPKYNIIDDTIISSAEQKGIIQYLGITNDVKSYILKSDCIVLPSYREGLPKSLCEAAAAGIPIVTTNTVGCTEVVKQGFNGELCRIKDHISLKKKLEKLIQNPKIRKIYGDNSYTLARKNFDIELIGNQIINIYNNF